MRQRQSNVADTHSTYKATAKAKPMLIFRRGLSADFEYVATVARLNAATLASLAAAPAAITLPVSKDNVVLAVRALDAQRYRSLPVVPEPQLSDKR